MDTLDLVDRVGYDESFSFIYSPRPNTTAKDLDDDVPLEEKKNRLSVLQHKLDIDDDKLKEFGTLQISEH